MSKHRVKTGCERCGTCCMKGGPALHIEDKQLLLEKSIDRESLITVRRGEPVFSLEENRPEWTTTEIIKLKGTNGQWSCVFFDQSSFSCSIYQHRPLECNLLKCWDTAELKNVAGKNLLARLEIIASEEPIIEYIARHEKECNIESLDQLLIAQKGKIHQNSLAELTELVNIDLALRSEALKHLNLNLDLELFYFGRPLFKILSQFDLIPREVQGKIILIQA
jgi:Fe-S-cluster containining protein